MASRLLTRVDEQGELGLSRRAEPNDVPIELVHRQKSAAAAFSLAVQSSGLEDKEVYGALNLDAGYFSRIKKGEASLHAETVRAFCDVVNNRIYPAWIAYQLGCTLVQIKTEAERQLELERARSAKLADENALLRSLVQRAAA